MAALRGEWHRAFHLREHVAFVTVKAFARDNTLPVMSSLMRPRGQWFAEHMFAPARPRPYPRNQQLKEDESW